MLLWVVGAPELQNLHLELHVKPCHSTRVTDIIAGNIHSLEGGTMQSVAA